MQKYNLYTIFLPIVKPYPVKLEKKMVIYVSSEDAQFELVNYKIQMGLDYICRCKKILRFYKNGKRRYELLKRKK